MKTNQLQLRIFAIFLISELMPLKSALCHNGPVHAVMTENAALASPELAAFLVEQFGANNAPFLTGPRLAFNPGAAPNMLNEKGVRPRPRICVSDSRKVKP